MTCKSVLHLICSSAFLGAERVVCELVSAANRDKFIIYVGLLGSSYELEQEFINNISISKDHVSITNFPCEGKFSFVGLYAIKQFLVEQHIDIIHCHGYKAHFYGLLAAYWGGFKHALVATNHTWKINTISEKIYKGIDVLTLRGFKTIVAVSEEVKDEMIRKKIPAQLIEIVNNGISIPNLTRNSEIRNTLGLEADDIIIGCVASLTPEKAHTDLILAFSEVLKVNPKVRLILVGDGPLKANLQAQLISKTLEKEAKLLGQRNDVSSLYQTFDIFALVSYSEGLPMAMLEAMVAGLPVVVTSVGAIPQVITTNLNGILVEPHDIPGIAASLVALSTRSDLRAIMGDRARATVIDQYSSNRMARDYESLYEKLIEMK